MVTTNQNEKGIKMRDYKEQIEKMKNKKAEDREQFIFDICFISINMQLDKILWSKDKDWQKE